MLNDRYVRAHPEEVRAGLERRHAGDEALRALEQWLATDARRRQIATRRDALSAALREAVSDAFATRAARQERAAAEETLLTLEAQARDLLSRLPNLPDERVPDGEGYAQNVEVRRWGTPRQFDFAPRQHDGLGETLGMLDLARATRLSGPRFPLLIGAGARLARALAAYMLDQHAQRGYTEIAPPHLLRHETMEGTAHLPHFAGDLYAIEGDELYLSPTAEVQLVALHAGETLAETDLPLAYTACTPAFRREAGSAGASGRGLIRQHQFDKVELVRVTTPEDADAAFDTILADAETLLRALDLPYRVVALCGGELPFSAARTWDLEVWMAAQRRWVEISSVSDCGTFQARRLALRYRPTSGGRARYAATLNGSALPIGRTLAALLEHGQRPDGSVILPAALRPYFPAGALVPPAFK